MRARNFIEQRRAFEAEIQERVDAALAPVRALHQKRDDGWCTACAEFNDLTSEVQEWPCPTIRAIETKEVAPDGR